LDNVEQGPQETINEEETKGHNNKTRFGILLLVVGLAVGYMVYAAFPGNALYFMSVTEFMNKEEAQDGRIVRVAGKLVDGSYRREAKSTVSRFQLIDKDSEATVVNLPASYEGVLPDLFFNPHSEIILQGSFGSGRIFEADTILVKCPSKYQSLEDELQATS
jgi:cytochrome c-type biogenesis protein CcmE